MTPLVREIAILLARANGPFFLAGGYSIDAYVGRKTREHEDLDFVVKRSDQLAFQDALAGWDLQAANPPGSASLSPWPRGHFYELPVHNIWCRKNAESPWDVELLFSEFEGDEWVYRRNRAIRGPMGEFSWKHESGLEILAPEIQLLYKSRSQRPKDLQDLETCLSVFSSAQKARLRDWIALDSGSSHPWVGLLSPRS